MSPELLSPELFGGQSLIPISFFIAGNTALRIYLSIHVSSFGISCDTGLLGV
jgi:hypothetical protein